MSSALIRLKAIVLAGLLVAIGFASSLVMADTIGFEDAFAAFGQQAMPNDFYSSIQGLVIEGNHYGLIGGVSRGDIGNFDLEGTNGPASLGINDQGQSIDLVFAEEVTDLCLDLGTAFFNQLPDPPQVRITTFRVGQQMSSGVVTVVDTIKNGMGTWMKQEFQNIDRVLLEPYAGRLLWAIDNLRIEDGCISNTTPVPPPPGIPSDVNIAPILFLLLSQL